VHDGRDAQHGCIPSRSGTSAWYGSTNVFSVAPNLKRLTNDLLGRALASEEQQASAVDAPVQANCIHDLAHTDDNQVWNIHLH
jgi:hypothetical protein